MFWWYLWDLFWLCLPPRKAHKDRRWSESRLEGLLPIIAPPPTSFFSPFHRKKSNHWNKLDLGDGQGFIFFLRWSTPKDIPVTEKISLSVKKCFGQNSFHQLWPMFISVPSSSSRGFFSHICQRHVSVAALPVSGLTPRRLHSSPHVFGFIEGDPNSIRGSCLQGKPGDTPGRITDAWAQEEASPHWALAWGERWGMSLGGEATTASAQNPAEPGAGILAPASHQCWGPSQWQGRPGKGRGGRGSVTPQSKSTGRTWGLAEVHPVCPGTHPLLAHGPRTHSQSLCDWRQAPAAPAYLANIHPGPQQTLNREAIIEWLLLNTTVWGMGLWLLFDWVFCNVWGTDEDLSAASTEADTGSWSQHVLLLTQGCPIPLLTHAQL